MVDRAPPGRAGRLWLERRIEVARRGADVLDQKRQTLLREQLRLARRLVETTDAWRRHSREAHEWNDRALAVAGPRRLRLAALHRPERAGVTAEWRSALGTSFPGEATVRPGTSPDFVALGGGSTVALSAQRHAAALEAAAEHAAVRAAHEAITRELAATTRRLRAIERRWIPEHEEALRRLELMLEERELEDAVRARWALDRARRKPSGSSRDEGGA